MSIATVIGLVAVCGLLGWLGLSLKGAGKDEELARQQKRSLKGAAAAAAIRAAGRRRAPGDAIDELRKRFSR